MRGLQTIIKHKNENRNKFENFFFCSMIYEFHLRYIGVTDDRMVFTLRENVPFGRDALSLLHIALGELYWYNDEQLTILLLFRNKKNP